MLFGVEMLLKVFGHGLYGYIQDGFNVFDGFIVLLRYLRRSVEYSPLDIFPQTRPPDS